MKNEISFDIPLSLNFDAAIDRVTEALKEQGFGVLTRVDIHKAFKEKIGENFRPYAILGACNPGLAHKALTEAPEAGLMLPCNVIVEQTSENQSIVRIVNPDTMLKSAGFDSNPILGEVGEEAFSKLKAVADELAQ